MRWKTITIPISNKNNKTFLSITKCKAALNPFNIRKYVEVFKCKVLKTEGTLKVTPELSIAQFPPSMLLHQ